MTCYSKPYEGTEPYIFFSYCHSDEAKVYSIIERLNLEGYRVWYDDGIHPGDDWPDVVAEHLDAATACVAGMSEMSSRSHNCKNEVSFAISQNKPLVSIVLEKFNMPIGMRLQMSASNYINAFEFDNEKDFFDRLFLASSMNPCKEAGVTPNSEQLKLWDDHKKEYSTPKDNNVEIKVENWFVTKPTDVPKAEQIDELMRDTDCPPTDNEIKSGSEEKMSEDIELAAEQSKETEEVKNDDPIEIISQEHAQVDTYEEKTEPAVLSEPVHETENTASDFMDCQETDTQELPEEYSDDEKTTCEYEKEEYEDEETVVEDDEKTVTGDDEKTVSEDDERTVIDDNEKTITDDDDEFERTVVISKVKRPRGAVVHVDTGTAYKFSSVEVTIGRSSKSSQIAIGEDYSSVGRHHADIFESSGNYYIKDNNSTNGTSVNGKSLDTGESVELKSLDIFSLAEESFIFFDKEDIKTLDELENDGCIALLKAVDTNETQIVFKTGMLLNRSHKWKGGALSDPKISRMDHAEIIYDDGNYYLTDTGSKNGTFIGRKRLSQGQKEILADGDSIRIADTIFQFQLIPLNKEIYNL